VFITLLIIKLILFVSIFKKIYIFAEIKIETKMETITNRFGELQTNWQSHKHPNNPNFMQIVKYMHIQYPDGRNTLYWALQNASANDKHIIKNITLSEAQAKFVDEPTVEITDEMFEQWLKEKK